MLTHAVKESSVAYARTAVVFWFSQLLVSLSCWTILWKQAHSIAERNVLVSISQVFLTFYLSRRGFHIIVIIFSKD